MQGSEEGSAAINALTTGLVSYRKPDGLILSTANLYFTSQDGNTAIVWRAAQSSSPGQEFLLWSEPGARFGDIVYAQVDGIWWAYFFKVASTTTTGLASIRRIPLTGGEEAIDINPEPIENVDVVNSHRNLLTDGVHLYWQDVNSVRRMPIRGGDITILDEAHPNTPTAGLALQNGNVIYASFEDIRYVPTIGAITPPQFRTIATASSRVTALHAVSNGIYWGEESGAIRAKVGSSITTLPSTMGLVQTSISTYAGVGHGWTQCGSQSCQLDFDSGGSHVSMQIGADAFGVTVTSSGNVFWGDATGVHRE